MSEVEDRERELRDAGRFFDSQDVPGLREESAGCDGYWRSEPGEGGLLGQDWVFVSD